MRKQWNKDIRDQLKDFPKKAPEGLLDEIKSEMTRRGLSSEQALHKNSNIFFRIGSIAAAILILLSIRMLWQKKSVLPTIPGQADSFLPVTITPNISETDIADNQPLVPNVSNFIVQANKPASSQSEDSLPKEETSPRNKNERTQEENEKEQQPQDGQTQETEKGHVQTSPKPKWTYNASSKQKPSISIGIYYSAGVIAQATPNNLFMDEGIKLPSPEDTNQTDTTETTWSRRASTIYHLTGKATHHLPVKLGISFRYNLDERWNVQSGLIYSYLASDISENTTKGSYDTKQKLHYIGIPLQVGYKLGESKHFRSYIATGGQVEKLVSGKATTRHSKNNTTQDTFIQDISDKRLLFSALASFGVEYALGETFSLYVEPSIHYYFKNGNGLQTHYNEQPLNINLTIGFRVHWKK